MRIEWHEAAAKEFLRLARPAQERIKRFLEEELPKHEDPRKRAEPYRAELRGYWKLRVGDYRLVCDIREDNGTLVLVILVAHRGAVYSRKSIRSAKRRGNNT